MGAALALGLLLGAAAGCVYQEVQPHPPVYWPSPAAPPQAGPHLAWLALLAAGLVTLVGVGLRFFHGAQAQEDGPPLDREDAALLRTARDALGLLLRKHLRRLAPLVLGRRR
ncbi:MAG: hypothetical protein C4525_14920 [Desulfarculus sp.]|nr:MAG: hypothetical protein C4525_14920 [Desulfarculus sp.]